MEKCGVYMCFWKENYLLDQVLLHWDIAYHFHWEKVLNVLHVSYHTLKAAESPEFPGFLHGSVISVSLVLSLGSIRKNTWTFQ